MTLDRFWGRGDLHPVPIGRIVGYAQQRFGGFKPIYAQLSEYAHPGSLSLLASHRLIDEASRRVEWRSGPAFKSPGLAIGLGQRECEHTVASVLSAGMEQPAEHRGSGFGKVH
jgi:hypothetical protein